MTASSADVTAICGGYDNRPDALIEILHDVQSAAGYISQDAMRGIAAALNISRADVYGTLSFYDDFRLEPLRENIVRLCRAEACQAMGADALAAACDADGIPHEAVFCLGNCALGPAAMVGEHLVGRASAGKLGAALRTKKGRA